MPKAYENENMSRNNHLAGMPISEAQSRQMKQMQPGNRPTVYSQPTERNISTLKVVGIQDWPEM